MALSLRCGALFLALSAATCPSSLALSVVSHQQEVPVAAVAKKADPVKKLATKAAESEVESAVKPTDAPAPTDTANHHSDGNTITSDWGKEYGPKAKLTQLKKAPVAAVAQKADPVKEEATKAAESEAESAAESKVESAVKPTDAPSTTDAPKATADVHVDGKTATDDWGTEYGHEAKLNQMRAAPVAAFAKKADPVKEEATKAAESKAESAAESKVESAVKPTDAAAATEAPKASADVHVDGKTSTEDWGTEYGHEAKLAQMRAAPVAVVAQKADPVKEEATKAVESKAESAAESKVESAAKPKDAPATMDAPAATSDHHVDGKTATADWGTEYGHQAFLAQVRAKPVVDKAVVAAVVVAAARVQSPPQVTAEDIPTVKVTHHANMESITGDWRTEYGPKGPKAVTMPELPEVPKVPEQQKTPEVPERPEALDPLKRAA